MIIKRHKISEKAVGGGVRALGLGRGTDTEEKKCHPFLWNRWEGERCGYRCCVEL